jgi:hypothetical protein
VAADRPLPGTLDPAARYWERADGKAVVLPSPLGAHGWEAMAYSPAERLVYIPAIPSNRR